VAVARRRVRHRLHAAGPGLLASIWFDAPQWLRETFGFLTAVLAWITVFSTGMIYACLKTIRQWNTPLVPANYLALGYASGSLLLLLGAVYAGLATTPFIAMSALIISIAAVLKAIYYFWIRSPGLTPTINTATGLTRAKVKLLDAGHTHGTFLTQEFGFQIARQKASLLRVIVFVVGFAVPGLMLVWVFNQQGGQAGAWSRRWPAWCRGRALAVLRRSAPRRQPVSRRPALLIGGRGGWRAPALGILENSNLPITGA
jgi:hypothetical protein